MAKVVRAKKSRGGKFVRAAAKKAAAEWNRKPKPKKK